MYGRAVVAGKMYNTILDALNDSSYVIKDEIHRKHTIQLSLTPETNYYINPSSS